MLCGKSSKQILVRDLTYCLHISLNLIYSKIACIMFSRTNCLSLSSSTIVWFPSDEALGKFSILPTLIQLELTINPN